jgi:hypothetical protein
MMIKMIELYQRVSRHFTWCHCKNPDGLSCSEIQLRLAKAGATTMAAVLIAAAGCGSAGSGSSKPCIPYNQDPNNPSVCTSGPNGPPPPPAQAD